MSLRRGVLMAGPVEMFDRLCNAPARLQNAARLYGDEIISSCTAEDVLGVVPDLSPDEAAEVAEVVRMSVLQLPIDQDLFF